jgi:hypothetical protein
MSPVVIETTLPLLTKLIVLCLLLYIPILFFTSVARRGRAPLASAVVPLTLTPLLLGAMAAGWTLVRLSRFVVPLTGGSAARAAGMAEALALLVFGAVIAAIVSGALLISAFRSRHPALRASAICFCASLAIAVAGSIAVRHFTAIATGP